MADLYSPSIVQQITDCRCFLCAKTCGKLDRHEIFHGAYREKSKKLGLWVTLCHPCHMVLHHMERSYDYRLKRIGQRKAMQEFNWTTEDFIENFGKTTRIMATTAISGNQRDSRKTSMLRKILKNWVTMTANSRFRGKP